MENLIDNEAQKIVFPEDFASHLCGINSWNNPRNFTRKNKGFTLQQIYFTPINLTELIKADLEFDMENLGKTE